MPNPRILLLKPDRRDTKSILALRRYNARHRRFTNMIIPHRTVAPRRVFRETTAQGWANRVGGLPPHLWLAASGDPDGEGVAIECSEIQAAALAWVLYEHIECTVAVEVEVHQNRTHYVANPKGRIVLKDFILTEDRP